MKITRKQLREAISRLITEAPVKSIIDDFINSNDLENVNLGISLLEPLLEEEIYSTGNPQNFKSFSDVDRKAIYRLTVPILRIYNENKNKIEILKQKLQGVEANINEIERNRAAMREWYDEHPEEVQGGRTQLYPGNYPHDYRYDAGVKRVRAKQVKDEREVFVIEEIQEVLKEYLDIAKRWHEFMNT